MSSFVSFSQFIRHGGQASIVLSLCGAEPALELKQSLLDRTAADTFERHLRDLASENWSGVTSAFARAGIEADPIAEDIEAEVARARTAFSEQASAILATADPSVANADISTLAEWLARRFLNEINERRQRQLRVTHFIWRTRDDGQVRVAHAERDDRVFSWEDEFPDGLPGHGYNCQCVAEPGIVDGTILLTDIPASPGLSDRIALAQGDGLADAAADAALGGATSIYNLVRFSWLGYRRLFGSITPEEEAERLSMREGVLRAIESLAGLDSETVRRLADAFVDHFDTRHADLRLLDLEFRLGLASEQTLLRAYRDIAYLDGATTLGATAFATVATRLGLNLTRLRPRDAFVALGSATARMETLLAMRRATVTAFVARRFAELEGQGHGPQRHEGAVTRQMLIDRVLDGKDPMTGSTRDGVRIGIDHGAPAVASRITAEASYVAADAFLRRSTAFSDAYARTLTRIGNAPQRFRLALPIEDVLGPDFAGSVEGVRRVGDLGSREWTSVSFANGRVVAVYELRLDGQIRLITLYPEGE